MTIFFPGSLRNIFWKAGILAFFLGLCGSLQAKWDLEGTVRSAQQRYMLVYGSYYDVPTTSIDYPANGDYASIAADSIISSLESTVVSLAGAYTTLDSLDGTNMGFEWAWWVGAYGFRPDFLPHPNISALPSGASLSERLAHIQSMLLKLKIVGKEAGVESVAWPSSHGWAGLNTNCTSHSAVSYANAQSNFPTPGFTPGGGVRGQQFLSSSENNTEGNGPYVAHTYMAEKKGYMSVTNGTLAAMVSPSVMFYGAASGSGGACPIPLDPWDQPKWHLLSQGNGSGKVISSLIESTTGGIPAPLTGCGTLGWTIHTIGALVTGNFDDSWNDADCSCDGAGGRCAGASNKSIDYTFNIGSSDYGSHSDSISINTKTPYPGLCSVKNLKVSVGGDSVIVLDNSGAPNNPNVPYQIINSTSIVQIDVPAANQVRIREYPKSSQGAPATLGYQITGSPARTLLIENPVVSGATDYNQVKFTLTDNGTPFVNLFVYNPASGQIDLYPTGSGARESLVSTWNTARTIRTETRTMFSAADVVLSKTETDYTVFPWGESKTEERQWTSLTSGAPLLTSTWTYYASSGSPGSYGRLQSSINPQGHWEKYEYDAYGRQTKQVSQYLNTAYGTSENLNRVVATTYQNYSTSAPEIIRIETVLGQEVARETIDHDNTGLVMTVKKFTTPTDSSPLTTTTTYNGVGDVAKIIWPNGTASIFTYTVVSNTKTTDEKTGAFNGTSVTAGIRKVTVKDKAGNVVSETTSDIASAVTIDQKTVNATDGFKRPTSISYYDSTTESIVYGCCGIESRTDRLGITTNYIYDERRRLQDEIQGGITKRHTYDDAGNEKIVTRQPGTGEILLERKDYDLAGRIVGSTDPQNYFTGYLEIIDSSGYTVKTTMYPNTGTRIETYNRDGSLLSVSGSAARPAFYEYGIWSASGQQGIFTKEYLGNDNTATEWRQTFTDMAGRTVKILYPDAASEQSIYNSLGQLSKTIDPDGIATLYGYNTKGEQDTMAIDLNANGIIDLGGTDRISRTTRSYTTGHEITTTQQYWTDANATPTTIGTVDRSLTGLYTSTTELGLTTTNQTTIGSGGARSVQTTSPDNSYVVQSYVNNRLTSQTHYNSAATQISSITYGYGDPHLRLTSATDARNGTTNYSYTVRDELQDITTPAPASGKARQKTSYLYDAMGQLLTTTLPDNTVNTNTWYLSGDLNATSGSQTYPTSRTYDNQGRLKTLTTSNATTAWIYDPQRGFLTDKKYEYTGTGTGHGPHYTYKPSGRLWIRNNERSILTTYGYSGAGEVTLIDYSDATPDVSVPRNRRGLPSSVTDAAGVHAVAWHSSGQLESDEVTSGLMNGFKLDAGYDALNRLNGINVDRSGANQVAQGITYDGASRLDTVSSGSISAKHLYLPNSNLIGTVEQKLSGTTKSKITRNFDLLNRLTQIQSVNQSTSAILTSFAYNYNELGQRSSVTLEDSSSWSYGYNGKGEVTSGRQQISGGVPKEGRSYGYAYDDIGNRTSTTINGRTSTYSPNGLNQYSQRTVPGYVETSGTADPAANVRFNGIDVLRQGSYFWRDMAVSNGSAAINLPVTVSGVKVGAGAGGTDVINQQTGTLFLPKTPEIYTYDSDGNQTQDGRWTYTWDGENRLIQMETLSSLPVSMKQKLEFTYDWQGRRVQKKVSSWDAGTSAYVLASDTRFAWHGWNLVAEFSYATTTSTYTLAASYLWGADLSGTLQGAGGVGGLAAMTTYTGPTPGSYFPAYDGNGNVAAMLNSTDAGLAARYEYGPFGEPLRATGTMAGVNPFRFSTKYQDSETGLLYYGYRYYTPSTGKWLNRDPIQENGGVNLYGMVGNDCLGNIDWMGLWAYLYCERCTNDSKQIGGPRSGQMHCKLYEGPGKLPKYHPNSWQMNASGQPYTLDATFDTNLTDPENVGASQATTGRANWSSITPKDPYGRYGPIPPAIYDVLPKSSGPLVNESKDGHFNFHQNTPSVTDPGRGDGRIVTPKGTSRGDLRIHMAGYSQGCVTCEGGHEWTVEDAMNRHSQDGGLKLEVKEVDCSCKESGAW